MTNSWVYVPLALGGVILLAAFWVTRPRRDSRPKPLPGALSQFIRSVAVRRQKKEFGRFQQILEQMNSDEVAALLLIVTSLRLSWRDKGIDLSDPFGALVLYPDVIFYLHRLRSEAMKQGDGPMSAAIGMWIFTLRAAQSPELRGHGRALWRELCRGYSCAVSGDFCVPDAIRLHPETRYRCGDVPQGIEPTVQ